MLENSAEVIRKIQLGDRQVMKDLYKALRPSFISFLKQYDVDDETMKDIFQDSMIAFYKSVVNNKYDPTKSSLKTYIYTIGKYKVIDWAKKHNLHASLPALPPTPEVDLGYKELTPRQILLKHNFVLLGAKCQEIIRLFYYRGLSLKDIVQRGYYKDENSVKSQKSRCISQLRALIKKGKNG